MRYEVPQFIEIEDKIFGPLTWRQFLYLGGGVGMAVVLFFTTNIFIFTFFGLPLALLAGALAFYPVNGRSFDYFLESIFNFVTKQRLYLWRKKADVVHRNTPTETTQPKYISGRTPRPIDPAVPRPKRDITSLARKLELEALQKTE